MREIGASLKRWTLKVRTIAAWLVILAFISLFISENAMIEMNPQGYGPWPDLLPRPKLFEWLLLCRNLSFLIALIAGLISIPRWQSLIGLSLTLLYSFFIYYMFVSW